MLSSMIRAAADLEQFSLAVRPSTVQLTVTGRGLFAASLTRIDLPHLWLQRGRESLPRIWHAGPSRERNIIGFLTAGEAGAKRNGVDFHLGDIALLSPRHDYRYRTLGAVGWAAMSLPFADMAEIGARFAGRDLMPCEDERIVTPPPAAMARLQHLHAAAAHLAEHAPEILAQPQPARGLEQSLIEAMVGCVGVTNSEGDATARRRHTLIMQRFHAVLEASEDVAVYVPELCARIGVSGRTLRLCCQEHLGIGPKRFLLLRRLHLARRELQRARGSRTPVTDIATRFGFWELGRFAVEYKAQFGESPSQTLKRPADVA